MSLQKLLEKAGQARASRIRLRGGEPVIFETPSGKTKQGRPLEVKHIKGLLKSALDAEVLRQMRWGCEIPAQVQQNGTLWEVRVKLTKEKELMVEMWPDQPHPIDNESAAGEERPEPVAKPEAVGMPSLPTAPDLQAPDLSLDQFVSQTLDAIDDTADEGPNLKPTVDSLGPLAAASIELEPIVTSEQPAFERKSSLSQVADFAPAHDHSGLLTSPAFKAAPAASSPLAAPLTSAVAVPGAPQGGVQIHGPASMSQLQPAVRALPGAGGLALIYGEDKAVCSHAEKAVSGLGYVARPSPEAGAVVDALKYTDFPIVILGYGGRFREDPVYQLIETMQMERRRRVFVVLVHPKVPLDDPMSAYALSVNLLIPTANLDKLAARMERGLREWDDAVSPFYDALTEHGRM